MQIVIVGAGGMLGRDVSEVLGERYPNTVCATRDEIDITDYWDTRWEAVGANYPDVTTDKFHIDILTAHFVRNPHWFDVVVGSNLFGDILSDLGPAVTSTIAIAPSANINPERDFPSMFEPVHGSAPDIAGQGIANPIGAIWSGAMMLEHLGHTEAARVVERAIETVLAESDVKTPDLGGKASCDELGAVIEVAVRAGLA